MSANRSAFASTSTDFRSGCGCEAIGADASRLSENASATARASGVPAVAKWRSLRATSWTLVPTLRNSTRCERPIIPP